ncbi:MAG: hypothetical protein RMK99_03055 [Anaerolineales bacterium]|nr:hypothetical protein [Anaerolineales bacterium]
MAEITLSLPDILANRLLPLKKQLPELLAPVTGQGLPLSAQAYRELLELVAARPTPQRKYLLTSVPTQRRRPE